MEQLVKWLEQAHKELDALDGKTIHREVGPTTIRRVYDGTTVDDDFVQKVSERLAEKLRREGVL